MEYVKRLSAMAERSECYFYRTASGVEVDLIVEHNRKLEAYEIKFAKTISKDQARSLHLFKNDFPVETAQLLSLQEKTVPLYEGVIATHWSRIPL